jgi:hypothetical protein
MYHGALDFAQQDPNWFAEMSTLWPHGQPAEEGALDFPGLAENPQPRSRRRNDAVLRDADNDVMMADVDFDGGGTRMPLQARRNQAPAVTPEVSDAEFEVQLTPRRQTRSAKRLGTESPKKASPKKAAKSPKKKAKKDSEEDSEPKRVQPARRGKK